MSFFDGKRVLVAGGTGLIGRQLVDLLVAGGAVVRVVSLDDPSLAPPNCEFQRLDLTDRDNCLAACDGMDMVFHLLCAKGSPKMAAEQPASFFVPNILFSFHLMEAARLKKVDKYLFSSSLAVYAPAEVFYEDDVWTSFPSPNDKFGGWSKRMGELQAEAYGIEYGWDGISIVRPANTYGPYDDFAEATAMVVPSLIRRAVSGENPLVVWGDGSARRDFVHARDVARGMMMVVEQGITEPVNLGSGTGTSVRELIETIVGHLDNPPEIVWDTSKPTGDASRVLDIERARGIGYEPEISIEAGIAETMDWFASHRQEHDRRYNVFSGD
ncbi:MAG: NAD-dependent epimerase/dehydratase family protein [Alphaproteobacteria bacterium]